MRVAKRLAILRQSLFAGPSLHGISVLPVIVGSALILRVLGVTRGLPYIHEWDEPYVMANVIGMLAHHSVVPAGILGGGFGYPTTYYFLLMPVVSSHYLYLHARGSMESLLSFQLMHPQAFAYWWYTNYPSFYLWARTVTAALGAATALLVFVIGRGAYGLPAGILSAGLLALSPGNIYFSDTVRVDIPVTFLILAAMAAGLAVLRRGTLRDYVAAGLLAGLAISTKQTALYVLLPLGVAHFLRSQRERLFLLLMILSVVVGVVIGTPGVLVRPDFVSESLRLGQSYGGLPTLSSLAAGMPRSLAYVCCASQGQEWYVVPHAGLGLLPALAALLGLVLGFFADWRTHLYLASFAVPYFTLMAGERLFFLRNMMPVLPFAALFAASGALTVWHGLTRRWPMPSRRSYVAAAALGVTVFLCQPAYESTRLVWWLSRHRDTRTQAVDWLKQHAAPGTRVAFERELWWFLPDLTRLPFTVFVSPTAVNPAWFTVQRIDFAVVGDRNPLSALPPVVEYPRPGYLPKRDAQTHSVMHTVPTIDPRVLIVRPSSPSP